MTAFALVLSVVAISALLTRERPRKPKPGTVATHSPCYFAVKNRAAGSPSVYWGPFSTADEATRWAHTHRVQVGIVEALHPDTPESKWWN